MQQPQNASHFLTNVTASNPIVIFSKPSCHLCDDIKHYLVENKLDFVNIDVTQLEDEYDVDGLQLVEEMKAQTGTNMFPFCYHEGSYVVPPELKKKLIKLRFDSDIDQI